MNENELQNNIYLNLDFFNKQNKTNHYVCK